MDTRGKGRIFALIRLDLRVLALGALTVLLGTLAVVTARRTGWRYPLSCTTLC